MPKKTAQVLLPEYSDSFRVFGNITINTLNSLWDYLAALKTKKAQIFIHSNGGDANVIFSMIDLLKKFDVTTIGLNTVQSAGMTLFLSGNQRYAFEDTTFMIHDVTSNSRMANLFKTGTYGIIRNQTHEFYKNSGLNIPARMFWTDVQDLISAFEAEERGIVTKIIH